MNVEENRLRTFSQWPANAAVDAARIAKAGFYYCGRGQEVQCFLCGTIISEWNFGDHAMIRHRRAQPECPFVRNPLDTCNVPMTRGSVAGLASSSSTDSVNNVRMTSYLQSKDPLNEYRTVSQRLKSFVNWPISAIVSPQELAKAGFYYLQHTDLVQCVYCGGIVRKWEAGDDPDKEHRMHFPRCDFYMHQDDDDTLELSNVKLMPGTTAEFSELGIQAHIPPSKPKYATYEARLNTLHHWPKNLKQTPEMLAIAGFYYNGLNDHVRCFHCDGGLRNWKATDDVWTEHARWFPKCGFVRLVKGQEFIKQCIDNRPPLDPSIFADVPETPPDSISTALPLAQEEALQLGLNTERVPREEDGELYVRLWEHAADLFGQKMKEVKSKQRRTTNEPTQCSDTETNDPGPEMSTDKTTDICTSSEIKCKDKERKARDTASLEEEIRRLREARLCKICMDREVAIVFLPCGHLAACVHCAPSLTYCPMCRQEIRATVRTFLS